MEAEILIVAAFDHESDQAVQVAWKVAEKLRKDYGIWVMVRIDQVWIHDPIKINELKIPQVYVNGKLFFAGRAPREGDLINAVMTMLWRNELEKMTAPAATLVNQPVFMDAVPVTSME